MNNSGAINTFHSITKLIPIDWMDAAPGAPTPSCPAARSSAPKALLKALGGHGSDCRTVATNRV
jgi:hypothetical protein